MRVNVMVKSCTRSWQTSILWLTVFFNMAVISPLQTIFSGGDSFSHALLYAQTPNAPRKPAYPKIMGISVEGNTIADQQSIIAISGLEVGDDFSPSRTQDAVKTLWRRKQFAEVDIAVSRQTQLGVYVVIKVKEFPRLSGIDIRGNNDISYDKIIQAVGKARGDILSGYDLYLAERAIKALYEKDGKQFAKVEISLLNADSLNLKTMLITVKESVNFYVKSIEFNGNKDFTDGELASAFDDTKTKEWYQFWKSSKFDKKKFEKDKETLVNFFRKNGYIDGAVVKDSLQYDENTESLNIIIDVNEGKKFYIRNITFEGNLVFPSYYLLPRLGFQKGDVYNMDKFEKALRGNEDQTDISSLYMNNGYLASNFQPEEKRIASDSVDIIVRIFERNQFTIRRVEVEGNTRTKDKVVRRELFTRPGDFFNRAAIIRSVRGLGQLNYFNPEKLKPDVKPVDNNSVDVTYTVEERSADTFNASIGYAGVFGLTGSVGITLNNFAIGEPLRGGGGQVFNFNWEFGGINRALNTFSLGFTEPWLFDEPTTLGANLFDTRQRFGWDVRQTGITLNIGRRFRVPDDYFRGDWTLQYRRIETFSSFNEQIRPGVSQEVSLRQTISRISIDNAIFPTDGTRMSLITTLSGGALGIGNVDYIKTQLNFELFNPVLAIGENNRLVLLLNSQFGYVTGLRQDSTIPIFEYYYMGGNGLGGFALTPLRGYPDRSVGPWAGGQPAGGRVMIYQGAELRFALTLNPVPIYIISFAEAGNVWSNFTDVNPFDLKRSVGLGVRLLLNPIGLLGFDYGYGFDQDPTPGTQRGPSGWKFHFQFGR